MATRKPVAKPIQKPAVTLAQIVAATLAGSFVHTSEQDHAKLVAEGLVEVNQEMTNESGEFATRATQKGIDSMNQAQAVTTSGVGVGSLAAIGAAVKSAFVLEDSVALPVIKRGGRGGEQYPFEQMNVGQSFFVAASEAKPDPAKSLASTVSSATARYAVETGDMETVTVKNYKTDEATGKRVKGEDGHLILLSESTETRPKMQETRKFVVRSVEGGARVWRTA
jgi:hypothetical protein